MAASNKKPYALRVDEIAFEKLKLIAETRRRSVNSQIEALIDECIAAYEAEHGTIELQEEE